MNEEQMRLLTQVLDGTFGSEPLVEERDGGWYIELPFSCVMVHPGIVEVETISGPREVEGWIIGVVDADGEFVEEEMTIDFWRVIATVAEMLAQQAVYNYRSQHEGEGIHAG